MVDALTIAHLAGALWMAAGAGTLTLVTFAGERATDRFALRFSAKLQRLSVLAAIVPGSLVAVAFGSWLASSWNSLRRKPTPLEGRLRDMLIASPRSPPSLSTYYCCCSST